MTNPVVTFEMANGRCDQSRNYTEIAPNTVNNFVSLVNKGFYDGLIFHRVISGFMIQVDARDGTGMGALDTVSKENLSRTVLQMI